MGGYDVISIDFFGRNDELIEKPIPTLTFVATTKNDQYLGPAPVETLAETIVNSRGKSGHNLEYVLKLAEKLREMGSDTLDHHLESLERACLKLVRTKYGVDIEIPAENEGFSWKFRPDNQELSTLPKQVLATHRSEAPGHHVFCNSKRAN